MIIGIPKEIKEQEHRVGITPDGVRRLVEAGHGVLVEKSAGLGAGIRDEDYAASGARIEGSHEGVYDRAEMIMKIKEPLAEEYGLLRPGQILFCYLHLASSKRLTEALLERKVVGIAFETVQTDDGGYPLLAPMSRIAGQLAILEGGRCLQRTCGGPGVLLSRVHEQDRVARVLVLGAGTVGSAAATVAAGLGAQVTVMDIDLDKANRLARLLCDKITVHTMDPETLCA
ncbi:MAG: 3-hydroxyacyl-CoA dehydrogenase NAD-binding domain-containing protein, partial [Pseudomonadota bacterium]